MYVFGFVGFLFGFVVTYLVSSSYGGTRYLVSSCVWFRRRMFGFVVVCLVSSHFSPDGPKGSILTGDCVRNVTGTKCTGIYKCFTRGTEKIDHDLDDLRPNLPF